MNRKHLSDAFCALAEKHGCAFVEATPENIAARIAAYPVAWLEPAVLQSKTGRYHGRITYSVKLRIMHDGLRMSPAERCAALDAAEQQLLDIFTELSTDPRIACIDELTVAVSQFAFTPHGEIAATAEAQVETIY